MTLPEPSLVYFIAGGVALYLARAFFLMLRRWWRSFHAKRHYNKYQSERDAYYNSTTHANPTANRHTQSPYSHRDGIDYVKDQDTKVTDIAEPKGFWTRFVMGEKMNLIREMIKISNSAQSRGYWQDRIEAQKRVEGQRQVGEDGPQR